MEWGLPFLSLLNDANVGRLLVQSLLLPNIEHPMVFTLANSLFDEEQKVHTSPITILGTSFFTFKVMETRASSAL